MRRIALVLLAALLVGLPARAQEAPADPLTVPAAAPVTLTLDEAVQLAVERAYTVRTAALDVETARAQVREAWGQLYPSLSLSSGYTRNVLSANPFAGSGAGGLFGSLSALDWLAYNEVARTDGDAATEPLTLEEFRRRQSEGQEQAGFDPTDTGNIFGVDNQFQNNVTVSQTLYSGTAFAAVRGARSLREFSEAALERQRDEAVHQARLAFYGALLAEQQVRVLEASVGRTRETVRETALRVAQGVLPTLDRLSAEVDLANLESQLVQARTAAETARDRLLFTIGLGWDPTRPVTLRGELALPERPVQTVGLVAAAALARAERPDLRQARLGIRLREVERNIERASYLPNVSAFATFGYSGSVPDDRSFLTQTGDFAYDTGSNAFFSSAYWQRSLAVGLSLNWTIFDGFQRRYRVQRRQIAVRQAEVQVEQAEQAAVLEVAQAVRDLAGARERVGASQQNVGRAETAYAYAIERLRNGVASQLDVRQASDGLDQARLNYLQAVYDVLAAQSAYERATGLIAPASPRTTTDTALLR